MHEINTFLESFILMFIIMGTSFLPSCPAGKLNDGCNIRWLL
ncbi:hypothetical protein ACFLQ4_00245 [Bacteroidota bacterium]